MKKLLLSLLLLSYLLFGYSQNWRPIIEGERHHFSYFPTAFITNTIYIDSVTTEGQEIIYHLNRIVVECDTCDAPGFVMPYLLDQGQFLQKQMVKQENGGYRFEGASEFLLYPEAEEGASWMYDAANGVSATVTAVMENQVFDQTDSIKLITLSNDQTILLSKSFGLLEFGSDEMSGLYSLNGLEVAELGEQLPNFWRFFDFNVGDVFQYYTRESTEPGTPFYRDTLEKRTILTKEILSDGFRYTVRRIGYWGMYFGPYEQYYFEDTTMVEYHYDAHDWFNQYPQEEGIMKRPADYFCYYPTEESPVRGIVNYYIDSQDQLSTKILGDMEDLQPLFCEDETNPDMGERSITDGYWEIYKEGLGLYDYNLWVFEVTASKTLQAYVKGGDTTGIIIDDDMLVSTTTPTSTKLKLELSPNPTSGALLVHFGQPLKAETPMQILSLNGQIMLQTMIQSGQLSHSLDVSYLPKGLYFLQLQNGNGQATRFSVH